MRTIFGVMLVLLVAGVGFAGDEKPAKPEGAYLLVAVEMKGDKIPGDLLAKQPEASRTFTFVGDSLTVVKNKKEQTLTIVVDASKIPAEISIRGKDAAGNDQATYGIYKIEGNTVTMCSVESNDPKDRPKEFKTGKDSKAVLLTLKKK